MLRFTMRSLVVFPPALLLAHFFGYAFGHLIAPLQAARNPLFVRPVDRTPLIESYTAALGRLARLDLGLLPGGGGEGLGAALARACLASLGLLGLAALLSVALGVGLGLLAVRSDPPGVASWLSATSALGLATPSFFFGVLGIAFVVMFLIWAPGRMLLLPLEGYGWDRHLVLPTIALMLRPTAQIAQATAGAMASELGKQYIVTARSIGSSERRIMRRHALRNALPAVVATAATALRLSAGELVVVETLFYWPGIGRLLAQALVPANSSVASEAALFLNPGLLGAALAILALLFLSINLAADLAMRALDPRLR